MRKLVCVKFLWSTLWLGFSPIFLLAQIYPTTWVSQGPGGGGAVYSPTISPHDPDEMYLTCDMSMAHHTTDFGQHWSMIPPTTLRTGRQSSVQFTSDPNTLYAMNRAAQTSVHSMVRSTDGGATWSPTASNPFGANGVFQFYTHPNKTTTTVVASFFDIFMDTTAGTNYTSIYHTMDMKGTHLAGVFFGGDTLFVGYNKGVKYSFDNGHTWSALPMTGIGGGEEIVAFQAAHEGATFRCIAITLTAADVHPKVYGNTGVTNFKNIYRLDFPSQSNWTSITSGLPTPSNDKLYNIGMIQGEIDTFYVGGQAWVSGSKAGSVFRTVNGGTSFQNVFLDANALNSNTDIAAGWKATATSNTYMHKWTSISSTEGLCVDPNNLKRLARSDLTAVHVSEDYGETWTQAYTLPVQPNLPGVLIDPTNKYVTNGMETTVGYAMHFLSEDNFFAGYGDILMTHTLDGGNSWQMLYSGLFFQMINDVSHFTAHPDGKLYASTGEVPGTNGQYNDSRLAVTPGKLAYSADQGMTWQTKTDFGHPVLWTALNPLNPDQIYAAVADIPGGSGGIWRCDDIANCNLLSDWIMLAEPPRTEGRAQEIFVLNDGTLVATYGPRDIGGFIFTASSGVFRYDVGGPGWVDVTPVAMQYDVRSITIDPNNDDIWFACIGKNGPGTKGLYRSLNRGQDWTLVQANMTVVSVTFHPDLPNTLYFCTSNDGLFFVTQSNTSFDVTPLTDYPFDFPQRVFFNPFDHDEVWLQNFGNGLRVGHTSLVLPIELLSFSGEQLGKTNLLSWQTAAEANMEKFIVERSANGHSFYPLGEVAATNQAGSALYTFPDLQPLSGWNYYRLKMLEFDGKFSFSNILTIAGASATGSLEVFPNPVVTNQEFQVKLPDNRGGMLQLFDVIGREVWQQETAENEALRILPKAIGLEKGVYFLQYSSEKIQLGVVRLVCF